MKLTHFFLNSIVLLFFLPAIAFSQKVGGPCEGCEALFEYGDQKLNPIDTLPGFETHQNQLLVSGTVYQKDGKTPAADVIIYVYHTDENGIYAKQGDETGWARRHGYVRGWVKTGKNGKYSFYTYKPASYPKGDEPAHIHITVKEPDKNPYWIDSIEFEGDPYLTAEKRAKNRQYGGKGIVGLIEKNGLLHAKRDIILGKNIRNYPKN